jgi:hypothetical protein
MEKSPADERLQTLVFGWRLWSLRRFSALEKVNVNKKERIFTEINSI